MQLLHKEILGAHAKEGNEHLGFEQPLWRDGRPAFLGIHGVKDPAHPAQHFVDLPFDRTNRVLLGHGRIRGNQTNQLRLGLNGSTHVYLTAWMPQTFKITRFSKAC
jgi:hypothetical protein